MSLEIAASGADEFSLLRPGHAVGAAAQGVVCPVPDLGKHQSFSIQHHQINLTETHVEISVQRFEAFLLEK